ncbi:hypothetical protein ALCH109712_11920 [Alkalicoccus chagannorensis]
MVQHGSSEAFRLSTANITLPPIDIPVFRTAAFRIPNMAALNGLFLSLFHVGGTLSVTLKNTSKACSYIDAGGGCSRRKWLLCPPSKNCVDRRTISFIPSPKWMEDETTTMRKGGRTAVFVKAVMRVPAPVPSSLPACEETQADPVGCRASGGTRRAGPVRRG